MKYPYMVIKDGVEYAPFTEIPETDVKPEKEHAPAYKKNDINRMAVAELKELAAKENIENVESLSGADLKKLLIEKFGL